MNRARDPVVTIAIPLHRSRAFVDVVSANIAAVQRNDVEILVSDRTGLDDALDVIARRYAHDPRVVPLRADRRRGLGRPLQRSTASGARRVLRLHAARRRLPVGLDRHARALPRDGPRIDARVRTCRGDRRQRVYATPARGQMHPRGMLGIDGEWTVHDGSARPESGRPVPPPEESSGGRQWWIAGRPCHELGTGLMPTRPGCSGSRCLGRVRYVPEVVSIKRWHGQNVGWAWEDRIPHRLSLARTHIALGVRHAGSRRASSIVARTVGRDFALFCGKRVWSRHPSPLSPPAPSSPGPSSPTLTVINSTISDNTATVVGFRSCHRWSRGAFHPYRDRLDDHRERR